MASLQDLQSQVIQCTETMALAYDIETDICYQQGREVEKKKTIDVLLRSGLLTDEQIAEVTDSSLEEVR